LPHSHIGKGLSAVCSAARWIEEDEWRGEVPGMGSAEPKSDLAGGIRWHVMWVLLGDVGTEVVDMDGAKRLLRYRFMMTLVWVLTAYCASRIFLHSGQEQDGLILLGPCRRILQWSERLA
jgi:hypothetical protein